MHRSLEYSIEAWPGVVRIHSGYDTEEQQTIELSPEQIPDFIRVLEREATHAASLEDQELRAIREKSIGKPVLMPSSGD